MNNLPECGIGDSISLYYFRVVILYSCYFKICVSERQSNFTFRRINEAMAFPYELVQQRSQIALSFPSGGF